MTVDNITLVLGGTLTGLLAGLLYGFSVMVMPALRSLKAIQHLAVMQVLNIKILNAAFFLLFFGPALLLPFAAFLHWGSTAFVPLVAASLLHLVGVNGITIVGNVPLNDRLAALDLDQLSDAEAERVRQDYHGPNAAWVRFHALRTMAAILAVGLVFIACLLKGSE